jgi:hypothetical protein
MSDLDMLTVVSHSEYMQCLLLFVDIHKAWLQQLKNILYQN